MRPTVRDIAETAGVSLATVDRVLNRRTGVRGATVAKVEAAISMLGYTRDIAAANLAKQRRYRLAFILPEGSNAFMAGLDRAVGDARARSMQDRTEISTIRVPAFDEDALSAALAAIDPGETDGVAFVAMEAQRIERAVARLEEAGVAVVTLVSDLPGSKRAHYVGIDNIAAGRTAGSLIGRFLSGRGGKVAAVAGSMVVRDHVERRLGFERVMRAEFPGLEILPTLEVYDDGATAERLLGACLDETPGIVGLYSIGAGNRGLIAALKARGLSKDIVVVAHELTDHARQALEDGTFDAIINQDAGHEVRSAIRLMKAVADRQEPFAAQERIRIDIFVRDNLP